MKENPFPYIIIGAVGLLVVLYLTNGFVKPTNDVAKKTENRQRIEEIKDSLLTKIKHDTYSNTEVKDLATVDSCPVKILSVKIRKPYLIPKAEVRLKNASKKTLDALEIGFYCYDNFNEPANGILNEHLAGGYSQDKMHPGAVDTYEWDLTGHDRTTKVNTFIRRIHFTDGTVWNYTDYK